MLKRCVASSSDIASCFNLSAPLLMNRIGNAAYHLIGFSCLAP
jgi:hypothetical protein